ncbi:hypothetical protein Taro_024469, partial [Colocasia esculenta]|nr:hypothetical protein [Colocasia esculenta]
CFWLDEETGKGCCMLSATDLWIALGNDRRYWRTTWHEDARSAQVAEMINVCWLDIQGNLMIQDLSIATLYTVSLIYKLNSENKGLEGPIRSSVTHGRRSSQRRVCMQRQSNWSNEEPRGRPDGWMELKLGEFTVQSGENETVYFGVKETERLNWKGGLVIEGIEVRPLWRVPSDDSSSAEPLDESEAERLLPSDYEEIFSRCVDRPKFSTKLDLYLQLCNSILIDEGRKSFMLERSTGKKCYVLSARDLSIIWGNDQRYWKWKSAAENSRFSEVAELLMVCWLDIKGSINTEDLSPHTDYSVYLIFKWNGMQYGFNDWLKASVSVGAYSSEPRRVSLKPVEYDSLPFERGDGWLEVEMGVFVVGDVISAEESVQFELKEVERLDWKRGLIIQGVEVKPKRMESSERLRRPTIQ